MIVPTFQGGGLPVFQGVMPVFQGFGQETIPGTVVPGPFPANVKQESAVIATTDKIAKRIRDAAPESVLVRIAYTGEALLITDPKIHENIAGKVGITAAAVIAGVVLGAIIFR